MDRDVAEKVLIVTGAADGIGLAMVNSFLQKGAKLAIILDINEDQGLKVEASLKSKYGENRVVFYKCDVVNDLETIYNKIIDEYKTIDVLINNAGIVDEDNIKRTINTNTIALMEWTMKFYEYMRIDNGGKGGTIINISSVYGYRITPYFPYYQASKFAIWGFSKSLGNEVNYKKSGVRVVVLCPGWTYTKLTSGSEINNQPSELEELLLTYEWQNPDNVGEGAVEIFEKGDSGTAWLVEGSRPAQELDK